MTKSAPNISIFLFTVTFFDMSELLGLTILGEILNLLLLTIKKSEFLPNDKKSLNNLFSDEQ